MWLVSSKEPPFRELDLSGCGTPSVPPDLFRYEFLTALNIAHNRITSIPSGIQRLTSLVYLDASDNKITAIPRAMHKCLRLQQVIMSQNLLTSLPAELALMPELAFLALEDNPLQEPFSSLRSKGTAHLLGYIRDNSRGRRGLQTFSLGWIHSISQSEIHLEFFPQPPEERMWVTLDPSFSLTTDDPDVVTVFSMNILAPLYATDQVYPYCPTWALNWDYRKERIMDEIFKYKADVICLQEMETEQFEVYFRTKLQRQGYQGIFCPKSRSKTMTEIEAKNVDGSAIFFKESK